MAASTKSYRKLLKQFDIGASIRSKSNFDDNAPIESFWGTLKNELVHHQHYYTRMESIQEIREYIEIIYNRQKASGQTWIFVSSCV
uniref:Integrase catalytic domain-containing protein n=1 Tax=uncultured Desulfobacterium sp. TaxID=201089 RepID=E1YCN5_9BACT|nr:hypothetical protein N47_G36530 [uncultured Desulfobacterium sp.]